jgi:hypothetical protein
MDRDHSTFDDAARKLVLQAEVPRTLIAFVHWTTKFRSMIRRLTEIQAEETAVDFLTPLVEQLWVFVRDHTPLIMMALQLSYFVSRAKKAASTPGMIKAIGQGEAKMADSDPTAFAPPVIGAHKSNITLLHDVIEALEDLNSILMKKGWTEARSLFDVPAEWSIVGPDHVTALFYITQAIGTLGAFSKSFLQKGSPFDGLPNLGVEATALVNICAENNWEAYHTWARFHMQVWNYPNEACQAYTGQHHFYFGMPREAQVEEFPVDDADVEEDDPGNQLEDDDYREDAAVDDGAEVEEERPAPPVEDGEEEVEQQPFVVTVPCPFQGCRHVCFKYRPPCPLPTDTDGLVNFDVPWPHTRSTQSVVMARLKACNAHYGTSHEGVHLPVALRRAKMHSLTSIFNEIWLHERACGNAGPRMSSIAGPRMSSIQQRLAKKHIATKFQRCVQNNAEYEMLNQTAYTKERRIEEVRRIINTTESLQWARLA